MNRQTLTKFGVGFLLALLLVQTAVAHGTGTPQLVAVASGPYLLTVWTAPTTLRSRQTMHVTVAVQTAAAEFVLDADVAVQVRALASAAPLISEQATTGQSSNKLYYETDFNAPDAGLYRFDVSVNGREGAANAQFEAEIRPFSGSSSLFYGLAIILAGLLFALYRLWQGRKTAVSQLPRRR